jgi:predicted small metal-binding protein
VPEGIEWGGDHAKMMTCADAGSDCPGQFRAETEDEVMRHVELHAELAHPEMEITPAFVDQVRTLVKDG